MGHVQRDGCIPITAKRISYFGLSSEVVEFAGGTGVAGGWGDDDPAGGRGVADGRLCGGVITVGLAEGLPGLRG